MADLLAFWLLASVVAFGALVLATGIADWRRHDEAWQDRVYRAAAHALGALRRHRAEERAKLNRGGTHEA